MFIPANVAKVLKINAKSKGVKLDWEKGDRVVVNLGTKRNPEFYIGTITRRSFIGNGKYSVLLDNGEKKIIPANSRKLFSGIKRKRKKEIPLDKVDNYILSDTDDDLNTGG